MPLYSFHYEVTPQILMAQTHAAERAVYTADAESDAEAARIAKAMADMAVLLRADLAEITVRDRQGRLVDRVVSPFQPGRPSP